MENLKRPAMPLGMLAEATYGVRSVQLQPRDKIVAYSDGLSDAENAQGKFFETSANDGDHPRACEGSARQSARR